MSNNKILQTKWYTYGQNNSGGRFVVDEDVAHYICVQAITAEEANIIASDITESSSYDMCPCCGERWYIAACELDGDDVPSVYGKSIFEEGNKTCFKERVVLYYFDGHKDYVDLK